MKKFILMLLFASFITNAAQSLDELKNRNPQMCQDIKPEDGYYGDMECARRLLEDSEAQLNTRLAEMRAALKKMNYAPYQKAFELDQKAWENYQKRRCKFITADIEKDTNNHAYSMAVCNASENYKRIETLKGEPSFS